MTTAYRQHQLYRTHVTYGPWNFSPLLHDGQQGVVAQFYTQSKISNLQGTSGEKLHVSLQIDNKPKYEGQPLGSSVVFDFSIPTKNFPQSGSDVVFDFSQFATFSTFYAITGELGSTTLTINSSSLGTVSAKTGEKAVADIQLDWKMLAYSGELAQVTTLSIPQQLGNTTFWSGELGSVKLSASYDLPTNTAASGESTSTTLTPGIPPNLGTVVFPTGEVGAVVLKTQSALFTAIRTGEIFATSLEAHPLITFSTNVMPTGEVTGNSLTAFIHATSSGRSGEVNSCVLTVTGPTVVVAPTGEIASTNLNIGYVLMAPHMMTTGESIVNTSVTINPAWHPSLTFVSGEKNTLQTIKAFYHAVITAKASSGENVWVATSEQTRWIDLAHNRNPSDSFYTWWDPINQQSGSWIIIDTYENQYPSIVHGVGINQFATAQLSIRPRFTAVASSGEKMVNNTTARILNAPIGSVMPVPVIKMLNGESSRCQLEADIKVPLCYGNIIPAPDFVFIEMSSPYGSVGCESWSTKTGETAFVARGGFMVIASIGHPYCPTGEVLTVQLTTSPPWIARAQTGEHANVELVFSSALFPIFRTGESTGPVKFQDMIVNCREGAIAFITTMHTNYDVFLDEQGCLNNEFVPQTPDGDNDYAHAPPIMPRELDPFKHFILSHCE